MEQGTEDLVDALSICVTQGWDQSAVELWDKREDDSSDEGKAAGVSRRDMWEALGIGYCGL